MKQRGKELGIFIIILVLLGFSYSQNHSVLSTDNIINTSRLIGIYGIMGLGMAFVIITGGIDLSIGSVLALLGVFLSVMLVDKHMSPLVALSATVGMGALLGLVNGVLVTRVKMQPFVVTLCGLLLYRGLARFISNDETKGFGDSDALSKLKLMGTGNLTLSFHSPFKIFGNSNFSLAIPYPILLLVLFSIAFFFLLHKSIYGRYLLASGFNEESARYAGIKSKNVITWAYVICGVTTGVAAVLLGFYTNSISPSLHGGSYELYAIAAAVLGGCSLRGGEGSIVGVLLGTTLILVIRNLVTMLHIPSSLEFAVIGMVIFVGVLLDTVFRKQR